jgi:hypothetical protein
MPKGKIEIALAGELCESAKPRAHLSRFAGAGAPSVLTDHRRLHAVPLDQLKRLSVAAGSDRNLVAARLHDLDERSEDERMDARSHVDPNSHR